MTLPSSCSIEGVSPKYVRDIIIQISYLCFIERGCISLLASHNKIQQTGLNNRNLFSYSFWGLKFKVKVLASLGSLETSLLGLQVARFAQDSFLSVFSFSLCLMSVRSHKGTSFNEVRAWLPTPVFWPGEFHGLYSPWGCKESDTTERRSHILNYLFKGPITKHIHIGD